VPRGLRRELKRRMEGRADVNVGKQGLTQSVLDEISRRLDEQEVVKVRVLKSALAAEGLEDRKEFMERLAERLQVDAMEVRGYTAVLYRRRKRRIL